MRKTVRVLRISTDTVLHALREKSKSGNFLIESTTDMTHSYAEQADVICPECRQVFSTDVWLIVDAVERPDLLERVRTGHLHRVTCPNGHTVELARSLLIYLPGHNGLLLCSPTRGTTAEQHLTQAMDLVSAVRERMGLAWSDTWIAQGLPVVPFAYLPLVMTEGLEAALQRWAAEATNADETLPIPPELLLLPREAEQSEACYRHTSDPSTLDQAVSAWEGVLSCPRFATAPQYFRLDVLNRSGITYLSRYWTRGELTDLDRALGYWEQAVGLAQDVPNFSKYLNNLGTGRSAHYAHSGDLADLEAAIGAFQQAIKHTPPDSPDLPMYLTNLGIGLRARYAHSGDLADLETAITDWQQAIALTPQHSPDLPMYLNNLGNGLRDRYAHTGDLADLKAAISAFQQAIKHTPPDSPDLPMYLSNLGNGLSDRYAGTNNLTDLNAAIRAYQRAVQLTPSGSPDLPGHLTNLGTGLRDRYARTGSLEALDAAIGAFQRAVQLTPRGSPDLPSRLTNLGAGRSARYAGTGNLADLDAAIAAFQQAANLTPQSSPNLPMYLANLGGGLRDRYTRSGDLADCEAAIRAYQRAVQLTPQGSPSLPMHLTNLGTGLRDRYVDTSNSADLDAAFVAFQQAVNLIPQGAPERSVVLTNMGAGLSARYVHTSDLADLEAAIQAYQQAINLTPQGAPDLPMYLNNLGNGLRDYYARTRAPADRKAAIVAFRQACRRGLHVALEWALTSSRSWGAWALERAAWKEAAQAYDFGLKAIDRLFRTQLLRTSKEAWLREAQGLHSCASYALARTGNLPAAVVALEQGRARLLAEALERARADLERLPARGYEDQYHRYRAAAEHVAHLERTALRQESLPPGLDRSTELRAAQTALEAAIEALQRIPGYEDFFRPHNFAVIQHALLGPLQGSSPLTAAVYLTITPVGGVALIVHPGGVQPVWLALTTADLDSVLVKQEGEAVGGGYLPAQLGLTPLQGALDDALPWLGERIMQPVATALEALSPPPVPEAASIARQVLLLPTGRLALLPLHAARYHKEGQERVFLDEFAVAYVPSARVLGSCRERLASLAHDVPTLFAVGNPLPLPPDVHALPFTAAEVEKISPFFEGRTTLLCESQATRAAVEQEMGKKVYLHFACHGQFIPEQPLTSSVLLSNGEPLTLAALYAHPALTGTRLAVLSACQTALTDFTALPEEAVGLPAGFVQAGVPGVVGSLWPVHDLSTTLLMAKFYECHLCGDVSTGAGPMPPARALRQAQRWLRGVSAQEMALADYWEQLSHASGRHAAEAYRWMRYYRAHPDEKPYVHPYYWAAFTFAGV